MAIATTEQTTAEYRGDHDGKSKTSSGVDAPHYPDLAVERTPDIDLPSHEEIAARAHRLWELRGCPHNTADQDWFEAEQDLMGIARDRSSVAHIHGDAGSVQK